jgi:serine O-acetyltransferase
MYSPFIPIKNIFKQNGFHARIFILLLFFEKKSKVKLFFKIARKIIIQGFYCSEVHPDSFMDVEAISTLRLPHPYMIIIHKSAKIGVKCTIFHECTIGVIEKDTGTCQAAILGENVYMGCKSAILGDIKIGNNTKIGAGSIILKDIPDSETVVGLWK